MRALLVYIFLLFLSTISFATSDTLVGYAPEFVGKEVSFKTYQDYITFEKVELGKGIVSEEDSLFRIPLDIKATIKCVIEIDRNEAELYIAPKTSYQVYFPKSEEPVSYKNALSNVYFFGLDSTDINFRILEYHQWFDAYVAYNAPLIQKGYFLQCLDTFKVNVQQAYADIDDPYFITYVRYDIAEMEQSVVMEKSEGRLNMFLDYIEPFPVYYENDRYMKFILGFYKKSFGDYLPDTEASINMAIYNASPTRLMNALQSDLFLVNPELRELIMIDKLGKAFYKEVDFRPRILSMLDSISNYAKYPYNAIVANNVQKYISSLEAGYPAPALQLEADNGELIDWGRYKGKFVYLNFFTTWSERAVQEMEIIADLEKKYNGIVSFLSICTDDSKETFNAYQEKNKYNWDVFYAGNNHAVTKGFKLGDVPVYYLIDQEGFLIFSPALSPSPNGEYKSIESTFQYIQELMSAKGPAPRVGEK